MSQASFGRTPKRLKFGEAASAAAARWQNSPLTPSGTMTIENYFKPSKQLLISKLNCSEPLITEENDEAVFPIQKSFSFPKKSESSLMSSTVKPVRVAKTNSGRIIIVLALII